MASTADNDETEMVPLTSALVTNDNHGDDGDYSSSLAPPPPLSQPRKRRFKGLRRKRPSRLCAVAFYISLTLFVLSLKILSGGTKLWSYNHTSHASSHVSNVHVSSQKNETSSTHEYGYDEHNETSTSGNFIINTAAYSMQYLDRSQLISLLLHYLALLITYFAG